MKVNRIALGSFALVVICAAGIRAGEPQILVDYSREIPDFCQVDPAGNFPGGGADYCGPVAVSNSFMFLGGKGFPGLVPPKQDPKAAQIAIIQKLGSAERMDTASKKGTSVPRLMAGVQAYVEAAGYRIQRLEHQGWRSSSKRYPAQQPIPSFEWLQEALKTPASAVWINVGWYRYDAETQEYTRGGGHWITVVGLGATSSAPDAAPLLLLHDPAPRTGQSPRTQHVQVERLSGGKVVSGSSPEALRRPADGFWSLTEGMVIKKGFDAAIVDAAVVLVIEGKPTAE